MARALPTLKLWRIAVRLGATRVAALLRFSNPLLLRVNGVQQISEFAVLHADEHRTGATHGLGNPSQGNGHV